MVDILIYLHIIIIMNEELHDVEAASFSALAHPLRLKILEKLRTGPCCVCKIIPHVGGEQSNVSHHLAILRRAGIVHCVKKGKEMWYEVADPRVFEIVDAMSACVVRSLEESKTLLRNVTQRAT
jgi:ArsR family transcriptional regulator